MSEATPAEEPGLEPIAIVGMSGRFPGAPAVGAFWENVRHGVESIQPLSDEDLAAAGVPAELRRHPQYVRAGSHLTGIEWFDAGLFGYTPREAELMDPQHRVLLECAWEALEHAGHAPSTFRGRMGVFAGASMNGYLLHCVLPARERLAPGGFQLLISSDKDYLATRISYKLGLRGPSLTVQTACSTSLVAVHLACKSLLMRECDLALAGGVSIGVPQRTGYLYEPSGILSPDGHCRPFGAGAQGTVAGDGAGLVVLRRLEDALADGDAVYAVIRGSAINNDGAAKVGFTAPSVEGQAEVIAEAQALAGVSPASVGYVEAHGTGTTLGDPIEVEALTRAMRLGTEQVAYCALGSVKANIGHLDAAAGVAGLIKVALALHHGEIPPTLHSQPQHPDIPFASSPFYLPASASPWPRSQKPRRAGVSSFGIGGTNAHAVLEEAPEVAAPSPSIPPHLLLLSAQSEQALRASAEALSGLLQRAGAPDLADVAFTLALGRQPLPYRLALVAADAAGAAEGLLSRASRGHPAARDRAVSFLFPGQGSQHPAMASALYEREPIFREVVDDCCRQLKPHLGLDLRGLLFPEPAAPDGVAERLTQTAHAQPALFVIEYALTQLWMSWGVKPAALLGHSVGEYAAACLAGVFSLPDALALVALRGRLVQVTPPGGMLSVPLPESALAAILDPALSVAAVNAPSLCVVAGPTADLQRFAQALQARGVQSRALRTSHAFHSALVEPALEPFRKAVARVELHPPRLPVISNVHGRALAASEATDPDYWAQHLRRPVRFADGLAALAALDDGPLLEVGPSNACSAFARLHPATAARACVTSLRHPSQPAASDTACALEALGRLWLAGASVDWAAFHAARGPRRRVPLPTYPFQRARYWVDPPGLPARAATPATPAVEAPAPRPPAHPRPNLSKPYQAPRSAMEERLAPLWEGLFGLSPIGVNDDFFELGGHSLLATQLLSALQDALEVRLPLSELFSRPTIAALAEKLAGASPVAVPPESGGQAPTPRPPPGGAAALSFAQEARVRTALAAEPGREPECVVVTWRLSGPLDALALERAIHEVTRRHDVLRATFHLDGGRLTPRISAEGRVRLASADLEGLPPPRRLDAVRELTWAELDRTYDLANGPLLFPTLMRLGREEHVLLVALHTTVGDGSSLGVIAEELAAIYPALAAGRPSPLPPLPLQYADFAAWQRASLQGNALDEALAYWESALRGPLPLLQMPLDRPRPAHPTFNGTRHRFAVPPEVTAEVRRRAQQEGVTLFMFLLAAWASVLGRHSGQHDVLVGSPSDDRQGTPEEVTGLIGLFVNVLPLRVDLAGASSTRALLQRVRATVAGAFDHPPPPLDLMVEELLRRGVIQDRPALRAGLTLYSEPLVAVSFGGITLEPLSVGTRTTHFELALTVSEEDAGLLASIEYNTDLFAERTVAALAQDVVLALAQMSAPTDAPPLHASSPATLGSRPT